MEFLTAHLHGIAWIALGLVVVFCSSALFFVYKEPRMRFFSKKEYRRNDRLILFFIVSMFISAFLALILFVWGFVQSISSDEMVAISAVAQVFLSVGVACFLLFFVPFIAPLSRTRDKEEYPDHI